MARKQKAKSRVEQIEKVHEEIAKLRLKFDAGEITRDQFIEMRKPLGERFQRLY